MTYRHYFLFDGFCNTGEEDPIRDLGIKDLSLNFGGVGDLGVEDLKM